MTIYIDIIIIENLIMNFIILYASSIILKKNNKFLKLFLSSLLGAIYAVISYMFKIEIYSSILLKILLSIVMVYIAFTPDSPKGMLKQMLVFYMTSFVFGGAALTVIYWLQPAPALTQNGIYLGLNILKAVFIGGIVGFIILTIVFKVIKSKITAKDIFYEIEIYLGENVIKTKAMVDTGNMLKEPITNIPVVIVEHVLLYDVIPKQILNNIEQILSGDLDSISEEIKSEYITKLKFIPFSSIGKTNGMLLGIKADKIILKQEEHKSQIDKVIIGIYNKSLTKRGEYQSLLGINMI